VVSSSEDEARGDSNVGFDRGEASAKVAAGKTLTSAEAELSFLCRRYMVDCSESTWHSRRQLQNQGT
jgi:hypothetical protein